MLGTLFNPVTDHFVVETNHWSFNLFRNMSWPQLMLGTLSRPMTNLSTIKIGSWNNLRFYTYWSRMATMSQRSILNTWQGIKITLPTMSSTTILQATDSLRCYLYGTNRIQVMLIPIERIHTPRWNVNNTMLMTLPLTTISISLNTYSFCWSRMITNLRLKGYICNQILQCQAEWQR